MLSALRSLDALIDRLPISPRFFRFCVVGTSGAAVSFVSLGLLYWALPSTWGNWEHRVALAGSICIAIFSNFLLNSAWTWGDREKIATTGAWFQRLAKFYLVSSLAATVQWAVAVLLYEGLDLAAILGPLGLYVCQATGILTAMFINFFANHLWTFRHQRAEKKKKR